MGNLGNFQLAIYFCLIAAVLCSIEKYNPNYTLKEIINLYSNQCTGTIEFSLMCYYGRKTVKIGKKTCTCIKQFYACCSSGETTTTENPVTTTTTESQPSGPPHPLDPLSAAEITAATQIISERRASSQYIFNLITLKEPLKSEYLPYFLSDTDPPPGAIARRAFVVLIDRSTREVYEVVVNLDRRSVESFENVKNVEPIHNPEEFFRAEDIMRNNETVARRCKNLGYPDMSLVNGDAWTFGYIGDKPQWLNRRIIMLYIYGKNSKDDNQYAHPFDFAVIVDLVQEQVIDILDLPTHEDADASNKVGNIVPKKEHNYDYKLRGGNGFLRQDDKPIKVTAPDGVSFKVRGNLIQWQKWKLRVGFNAREGPIIHTVSYNDSGKVTPICYRASVAETFIPYADPRDPYYNKAVFDMSEYGMGFSANQQRPGEDVVSPAEFMTYYLNNEKGGTVQYKNVVSVTEEDAGILWKHVEYRTGNNYVTRSHRLVITTLITVTNYDYFFHWRFYQDGSIQVVIEASGILSVNMLAVGSNPAGFGTEVAPQINAQYHQHFFAVRLDVEIGGNENTVHTNDAVPLPDPTGSPGNPFGNGFITEKTQLSTSAQGRSKIAPEKGRTWIVSNPNMVNPATGTQKSWKLVPENRPPIFMRDSSPIRQKARFMDYDMWVIPYKEGQLYPAGNYPNHPDGTFGPGIEKWVDENPDESIVGKDIVLFHCFGLVHIPRVEDYPVMPVESTAFWFKPYNFFTENPGVDVPPPNTWGTKQEL